MKIDYSQTYLYKLHVLTNALDKLFDDTLQKHAGISLSQFTLLITLSDNDSINQTKIAAFLSLSPAAISRRVEVAQSRGWLVAHNSSSNRRDQIVQITPAGKKVIQRGLKALEKHVFEVFREDNLQIGLMQHIDLLLANIKGAVWRESDKKGVMMNKQIPLAKQLYRGDINDAVIRVQKSTGIEIDRSWWEKNVGNSGSTESILGRFDKAYAKFVADTTKNKTKK